MNEQRDCQQTQILAMLPELPDYGTSFEFLDCGWISVVLFESYAGTEIGRTAVKVDELSLAIGLMRIAASVFETAISAGL